MQAFMDALDEYVEAKIDYERSYRQDANYASSRQVDNARETLTELLRRLLSPAE